MSFGTFFLLHFFHFFYSPLGQPWYTGAVWGNVFVILVLAPLGWFWSKTKFWPLNLVHQKLDILHAKHDAHAEKLDALHKSLRELHVKHDQLQKNHHELHDKLDQLSPS